MRKLWLLPVLALLVPSTPRAQVSLGLRLGYAKAQGNVGGQMNMDEWVNGQFPVQLDALVRVTPRLAVGLYGSYGFGLAGGDVKSTCESPGVSCSLTVIRTGIEGLYSFTPGVAMPWLGVGVGYEWNTAHFENGSQSRDVTFSGFEWVNVQGGADFVVAPSFAVGPYLMASVARYERGTFGDSNAGGFGGEASQKSIHAWMQLGVRARFDL
jgi:hypothetical protein